MTKPRWAMSFATMMLLAFLSIPGAHAIDSHSVVVPDSADVIVSWSWGVAGGSSQGIRTLNEMIGNDDGTISQIQIYGIPAGNNCGAPAQTEKDHVSCNLVTTTQGGNTWIWRNATAAHKPGNYTFNADLRDVANTVIARFWAGIRIVPDPSTEEQVKTLETKLNNTITGEAQGTRARINATNCLDNICSSGAVNESKLNETLNITLTKFSSDCHGTGTNLCINGHVANATMDNTVIVLLLLGFLMALTWAGIQPGFGFPAIALFGGLGYILFLLTNVEYLPNIPGTGQILVMLGLIPITLGGFNFNKQRNSNKPT